MSAPRRPVTLVGLSGYATSGKDAAAASLLARGWQRKAFADHLRQFVYLQNPLIPPVTADGVHMRLASYVDALGWDDAKAHPEVRALLQRTGTDAGRQVLGENVWIEATLRGLLKRDPRTVVTDVRFPNEAFEIQSRGGVVVRIDRPGVGPRNAHASETAMDHFSFDAVLTNDGSVVSLGRILAGALMTMGMRVGEERAKVAPV